MDSALQKGAVSELVESHRLTKVSLLIARTLNPIIRQDSLFSLRENYETLSESEWNNLYRTADENALVPAWYSALRDKGWLYLVPEHINDAAYAMHALNRDRNKQLLLEATVISAHLKEINCTAVYLKGMSHILNNTHCDVGSRQTTDLDILVPKDRVQEAAEHLIKRGAKFYNSPKKSGVHIFHIGHHLAPLVFSGFAGGVELHFAICRGKEFWPIEEEIFCKAIWAKGTNSMLVPSIEHSASISITHSLLRKPGPFGYELHLRDFWDLMMLCVNESLDLNSVYAQMRCRRQKNAFKEAVFILRDVFLFDVYCADLAFPLSREIEVGKRKLRAMRMKNLYRRVVTGGVPQKPLPRWSGRMESLLFSPGYRRHLWSLVAERNYRELWRSRYRS